MALPKQNTKYINQYNKAHYSRVSVDLTPEYKTKLELAVAVSGCKSIAEYIRMCVDNTLGEN